MDECNFNHEGFCILQEEHPDLERCSKAKGKLQICTAKDSDLIELCPDCEKPTTECDCGTCWVMVTDKEDNFAIMTPKEFQKLQKEE